MNKELESSKRLKKVIFVMFVVIIVFIVTPLIISFVIQYNKLPWIDRNNDWIGFWGSYLGGLITLAGVILTTRYNRERDNESYRARVKPFLYIQSEERGPRTYNSYNDKVLALTYQSTGSKSPDNLKADEIVFGTIGIYDKLLNTGVGPAIDVNINKTTFIDKIEEVQTVANEIIIVNDEKKFCITFNKVIVNIKDSLKSASFSDKYKFIIKVEFRFKDILGNSYMQEAIYQLVVEKKDEEVDGYPVLSRIENPILIKLKAI